jgi:hypothetical protein
VSKVKGQRAKIKGEVGQLRDNLPLTFALCLLTLSEANCP